MVSLSLPLCVLVIVLLNSAESYGICDLANAECTTKAAQNTYKILVPGVDGVVQSSDPLNMKKSEGELPNWKFNLNDITLNGLKNCQPVKLTINEENLTFQEDILCPELVQNYGHDIKGLLGPVDTDGKGRSKVTYHDYKIILKGKYRKFTSDKDHKLHFTIVSHEAEFEPGREIKVEVEGPLHTDESKSAIAKSYIQNNLKDMEMLLRTLTMKSFMAKFVSHMDTYWKAVPVEKLFPA